MSISTILGLFAAIGIIFTAMAMTYSIDIFFSVPAIMIVFGGTIAATMIRFSITDLYRALGMSLRVLKVDSEIKDLNKLIDITEDLLRLVRQRGILAMDNYEVNNAFFAGGVRMLVDGYTMDLTRQTLRERNKILIERAQTSAGVFRAVGEAAPAFGMMGTLVGLIQMLANLSDPSIIGPAMAVAMLTTLYGIMIANLLALPIADKIESWVNVESYRQTMIIDAIDSIGHGHNPAIMRELLSPYLQGHKMEVRDV